MFMKGMKTLPLILIFLSIFMLPGLYNYKLNNQKHNVEIERSYKGEELVMDDVTPEETSPNDPIDENVNEPEVSKTNIEIKNIQKDNEDVTYTYNVIIRDVVGATRYSIDGKESYTVFSSKGETTLTLKANQTLIIYDIPYNTYYSIEQVSNNKYVTSVNNKNQNIIEGVTVQSNIITFNNTSKVVSANPNTADYSIIYIVSAILSIIAFILLIKTVKVKRFTN